MSILLENKKAKFEYQVIEVFQAGMNLTGVEVKWLRNKELKLDGTYIVNRKAGLMCVGMKKMEYDVEIPLLLNKKELNQIRRSIQDQGITCIPLRIKVVGRWLKMDIAIAKGKKLHDKRKTLKDKAIKRDIEREMK